MSPLVTIGIPCFNSARWLANAIESALAQTWPAIEVIVVDDGSTDHSPEIAKSFGERVRFFRDPHRGATSARNRVFTQACGEWVQFLDADDYLEPEKIATQLQESDGGERADVVYSPVWVETETTREPSPTAPASDLYSQWLAWEIPQTGGCLWRRSALAAIGGWKEDQPCCQEHELYLRALKASLRFVFAPTPHAVYRIWSDETLCRRDARLVVRERTKLIDNLHAWLTARCEWTGAHQRVAGQACFEMCRTIAKYDLTEAGAYYRSRRERGLLHLHGPAAPTAYRVAHDLLGFSAAETLAAALRR